MKKQNEKGMKKVKKEETGITLIALVITVIVLLILAGVSVATLTGENGILTRANESKEETEESKENELRTLTALEAATNTENTTHTDDSTGEEKTVTIPAGFAVSQVEGENTIADGLVVIDKNGNEFVWIPVDGILWDEGSNIIDVTRNGKLLLGRYVFDNNGNIDENLSATSLGEQIEENDINFTETSAENGNKTAKEINTFIQSVKKYKGYYISRYEAGITGFDENNITVVNSGVNAIWTGYTPKEGENLKLVSKKGEQVWNYITQNKASEVCQNLYTGIKSDLINSYAWDTTILYIQKYGTDSNYSNQSGKTTTSTDPSKTGEAILANGTGTGKIDKQCNIYNLASNCRSWTTETSDNIKNPCVCRGGYYSHDDRCTKQRFAYGTSSASSNVSFRPILYF